MKYSILGENLPQIVKNMRVSVLTVLLGLFTFSAVYANSGVMEPQQAGRQITGTVIDGDNEPLIGVSILVKGTTNGTVTDIDGKFSLQAPSGAVLVFSYIGYEPQEVNVGNQSVITVKLSEDSQALEEVVVVGYGTLKRKEVTSAVETIRAEDFVQGATRNVLDLIQGKVAGLNLTNINASDPNSGMEMQLRGVSSIKGTRKPLVVIDGIPGGNLELLQKDDIESFSVLKDGSAAAIYGTRGNSGVILITTKKGRVGAPQFDYNMYVQHEFVAKKPDILSSSQYRGLIKNGLIDPSYDYGGDVDVFDELINKGNVSHYHNFSMSGGAANTNYRASIYFNNAEGIAKENSSRQFGGRVNINQKGLQDRLTVSVNLATNMNKANLLGGADYGSNGGEGKGYFEQAIQWNPTLPLVNEDGTYNESYNFSIFNPLSRMENRIKERDQQTTSADARARLEIIDGLSASVFGAYTRNQWNDRYYRKSTDWSNRPDSEFMGMGFAEKKTRLEWSKTLETTIDYRKTFNEKHTVTGLLGYSYQYNTWERTKMNNSGFTTDAFEDWNFNAGGAINNTQLKRPELESEKKDNTLISFFGRVNYSYDGKYHIQALVRREGSSKFGANHKWGNFPAISAGWTVSEEAFMQDITQIDELKLRIGYGVTGNEGIDPYQSLVRLSTGGVYPQEGTFYQTYGASNNPNPDLKWEQKKEINIGLDFGIFNNRITGSLDFFNRNTTDLLYEYNAPQPPYVKDKIWTNVGTMRSRGFEFQVSAEAIQNKNFTWGIDLTGSTLKNELTELSNEQFKANYISYYGLPSPGNLGDAFRLYEGGSPGDFYGKRFAGFDDNGKWLFYKADGTTGYATELSDEDLTIIGNGIPKFQLAFNNRFTYKNFDLTILFRGKFGYDILNVKEMYFGNTSWLPNNMFASAVDKHADLNDDPQYSDYYVEKGNFLKLDNVTLGYTFKLKTAYIRNLRVYASARNLLTITKYSGLDPELDDTGFEPGVDKRDYYPRTTSLTFGLSVGF